MGRKSTQALLLSLAFAGSADARVVVFQETGFPTVDSEHVALDPGRAALLLVARDGRVVARYPPQSDRAAAATTATARGNP